MIIRERGANPKSSRSESPTFRRYTFLPSIFMTGVHPPSPHSKFPKWQRTGIGFESRRRVTSWLELDLLDMKNKFQIMRGNTVINSIHYVILKPFTAFFINSLKLFISFFFSETRNFWSSFLLPSYLQRQPTYLEQKKEQNGPKATSEKCTCLCFLRGPLRWLTGSKRRDYWLKVSSHKVKCFWKAQVTS